MKVALVHDYIKEYGGAERVLFLQWRRMWEEPRMQFHPNPGLWILEWNAMIWILPKRVIVP